MSSSSVRSPSAIACQQPLAARVRLLALLRARGDPLFELARGFLAAAPLRRPAPPRARPVAACAARASAALSLSSRRRVPRAEQRSLRVGQPLVGGALLLSRRAIDSLRLRCAARRARRAPLPPDAARGAMTSALRASRARPRRRAPAAPRSRRSPSPGGAVRRSARRSRWSPARSSSSSGRRRRPAAPARRGRCAIRSRSSLISRLVARMPRDSALAPPDTRCGPRNTSPSSVATGAGRLPRQRHRLLERLGDVRLRNDLLNRRGVRADDRAARR